MRVNLSPSEWNSRASRLRRETLLQRWLGYTNKVRLARTHGKARVFKPAQAGLVCVAAVETAHFLLGIITTFIAICILMEYNIL